MKTRTTIAALNLAGFFLLASIAQAQDPPGDDPYIYFVERVANGDVKRLDIGTGGTEVLQQDEGFLIALAIDTDDGYIYWAGDVGVRRKSLDGSGEVENLLPPNSHGLALDLEDRMLYYVSSNRQLNRLDLTDFSTELLGHNHVYSLVVDPIGRKIYWTENRNSQGSIDDRVSWANMDGVFTAHILYEVPGPFDNQVPASLAIDQVTRKLYVAVAGLDESVVRSNLAEDPDGLDYEIFVDETGGYSLGITIDTNTRQLYWSNLDGEILRTDLDGIGSTTGDGANIELVIDGLERPEALVIEGGSTNTQCSIPQDSSPPTGTARLFAVDDEGFTVNACSSTLGGLSNINNKLISLEEPAAPFELYGAVSGFPVAAGPNGTLFAWIDDTVDFCGTILTNEVDPTITPGIWNMRTDGTGLQLVVPATDDLLQWGLCFDSGSTGSRPPRLVFVGGTSPGTGLKSIRYIEIDPLTGGPIGSPQLVVDSTSMPEGSNFIDLACDPDMGMIYATDNGPGQRAPGADGIVWRMNHQGNHFDGSLGPENWFVVPGGSGRFSNPLGIGIGAGVSEAGTLEDFIYVLDKEGLWGKITAGPQSQDPPKKLVEADALNEPFDPTVAGADVFWTDRGSGEIRRVDWTTRAVRCYTDALIHPIGLMSMTPMSNDGPQLVIPTEIPASFGAPVEVPITFTSSGFDITATTFSVDYDETCLGFDPADANFDGIPDNVSLSIPADFKVAVTHDVDDADGEFDIAVFDDTPPLATLPDSVVVTITFQPLCEPVDSPIIAPIGFSTTPMPTFGDTEGQDVPGSGINGSVAIHPGLRGDCNGDSLLTAGDLSACILEVFDDDGNFWLDVPGDTFAGSPVGCDANGDTTVNAGDLSCKILLIFEGPGACAATQSRRTGWGDPTLSIGSTFEKVGLYADAAIPVYFQPRGWDINSLVFSLDYDESAFTFDPTDRDRDGIPDSIRFDLPANARVTVVFDPADRDGEIDIAILNPGRALVRDERSPLLSLLLRPRPFSNPSAAGIRFSLEPAASFGDVSGQNVDGVTRDGLKP